MSLTKVSQVSGLGIVCRELTVQEIRDWLKAMAIEANPFDLVGDTLIEDFSLTDLMAMTDATVEQLGARTPSELRQLHADCREVNGDFFALRGRVEDLGRSVQAQSSNNLNATQEHLSGTATQAFGPILGALGRLLSKKPSAHPKTLGEAVDPEAPATR